MNYEYINPFSYFNNVDVTCGYNEVNIKIPYKYYKPKWRWDLSSKGNNIPTEILPNDSLNGVNDADFVVFISVQQTSDCNSNTLAYALTCVNDQFGRPIAGYINFCENSLTTKDWSKDVMTTLHELTHALAFSDNLYPWWINPYTGELSKLYVYPCVYNEL